MKDWLWWALGLGVVAALAGGAALVATVPGVPGSPTSDIIQTFANAIAVAEGFFIAGSRPQRTNNPGDINLATYGSVQEGWQALYNQVYLMFYGGSQYYNPSQTIAQVGYIYADGAHDPTGASNWASNVASALGVTTDTTLQQLLDAQGS
jgi:hypothetical protein